MCSDSSDSDEEENYYDEEIEEEDSNADMSFASSSQQLGRSILSKRPHSDTKSNVRVLFIYVCV